MLVYSECGDESSADKLSIGLKICEQYRRIIQVEKSRLWRPSPSYRVYQPVFEGMVARSFRCS